MKIRRSLYHQKRQSMKSSLSSKFCQQVPLIGFVTSTAFIVIGVLVCILNIINIIPGPWTSIIGIIFTGAGLVVAFYAMFTEGKR